MKNYFFNGAKLSIPIVLGYTPVAISFGAAAKAMGMALYSLFISLLVTALFGNFRYIYVILTSITLNILLSRVIQSSWDLLISIVISPLILTLFKDNRSFKDQDKRGLAK